MRFLVMVKMREDVGEAPPVLAEAMGRGIADALASGLMVDAGGLFPTALSTEIRVADLHREFGPGWEGSVEVRRIADPTDGSPPDA
jgi:hypothetical protein